MGEAYRDGMEESKSFTRFQKVALAALVSVICLIFVGAIVRATGAGMGCPDWPKCWGQYIPPTDVSQIDVTKLPIEKYKAKRASHGGNPDDITEETVLAEFNPTHTWIEFINRMCSMPVGGFSVLTLIMAFKFRGTQKWVFYGAFTAVVLVGVSAWLGKRIVESGLQPGTITTHMALAILLMCVQVAVVWGGAEKPWSMKFTDGMKNQLKWVGLGLMALIVLEGVMGSQVREMTDELKNSHGSAPRSEWVTELEQSLVYIVHRSFSWAILIIGLWWFVLNKKHRVGGVKWQELLVLGTIFAQMILGLILSNVGVLKVVQVLHIGLSSLMVCGMFVWLLGVFGRETAGIDDVGGSLNSGGN